MHFTVRIEIPELGDLVAYLRDRDQRVINDLTAKVAALRQTLNQSTEGLEAATEKQENP